MLTTEGHIQVINDKLDSTIDAINAMMHHERFDFLNQNDKMNVMALATKIRGMEIGLMEYILGDSHGN